MCIRDRCALDAAGGVNAAASFAALEAALDTVPEGSQRMLVELRPAEPAAPSSVAERAPVEPTDADGALAEGAQWWLVRAGGEAGTFQLESAVHRGHFLGVRSAPTLRADVGSGYVHRDARLVSASVALAVRSLRAHAGVGAGEADVVPASFALDRPLATYPPLAFWLSPRTLPPVDAALGAEPRALLAYALNEVIDEHYAPYLCLLGASSAAPVPVFCS